MLTRKITPAGFRRGAQRVLKTFTTAETRAASAGIHPQPSNAQQLDAVKQLRRTTNGGVVECKQALHKFNWDLDAAIAYIRQRQQASEVLSDPDKPLFGKVAVTGTSNDPDRLFFIELNCNCDFITSSDAFQQIVRDVGEAIQSDTGLIQSVQRADLPVVGGVCELDLERCNDVVISKTQTGQRVEKVDEDEHLTVGQKLKRISSEYKRAVVLSNVLAYVRKEDRDYIGIYVHQQKNNGGVTTGSRLGFVNLTLETERSGKQSGDHYSILRRLAKTLAIQLVATPPNTGVAQLAQDTTRETGRHSADELMNQFTQQQWLQLDNVKALLTEASDGLGKPIPHVDAATTIGQTLQMLSGIWGSGTIRVRDAVYMNAGECTLRFGDL